MAIDTSMFAGVIPAATYTAGDVVTLSNIRGPKIVRDGYGAAKLKRIMCMDTATGAASVWKIIVRNSNWVDEMSNIAVPVSSETLLSNTSGAVQSGNDCALVKNSGWEVTAVCIAGATDANPHDLICLIDIDYPAVAAVQNPREVQGTPVTIDGASYPVTVTATGSVETAAVWTSTNVDFLKAGYRYLLVEAAARPNALASSIVFVSISRAAGQAGLERIIPSKGSFIGMKYVMDYSTPLLKGPMDINIMAVGTAASGTAYAYFDFVKKTI